MAKYDRGSSHMRQRKMAARGQKREQILAEAKRNREQRSVGYRDQALKMFPHICGRCTREFSGKKLRELTVHHKDHDHDNNPPDGSNWELLCIYCHDMEHQRYLEEEDSEYVGQDDDGDPSAIHKPFANLKDLLKDKK
jgi:hypothetical protein